MKTNAQQIAYLKSALKAIADTKITPDANYPEMAILFIAMARATLENSTK